MPKRKQVVDSEEEEAFETPSASEDEKPKKSKQKAKATAKKPKFDTDDEDGEEERPLKGKKASKETAKNKKATKSSADPPSGEVQVDSNGDKYIDLGKKKRVTVRSFKGQSYVDVREYWGQEGDEKPGKKGVSMTVEQWETLKSATDTIDVLLSKLKK